MKSRGFTLIELIIGISIVALIATAVFVSVNPAKRLGEAKDATRQSDLIAISKAIELYMADYGSLPDDILSTNIASGEKYVLCSSAGSLSCDGQTRDCLVIDNNNFITKMASLPVDPDKENDNDTGYYITRGDGDNLVLGACNGYDASDVVINSRVKLAAYSAPVEMTITHTSDADFSGGTLSSVVTSGSGDSASIILSGTSYSSSLESTAGSARNLIKDGDYLYIGDGSNGLEIFDVSSPATPSSTGGVDTGSIGKVAIYGNYAYLADSSAIDIVDISDKYNPTSVGTMSFFGSGIRQVYVDGSILYVVYDMAACAGECGATSLRTYSLASPTSPSVLDTLAIGLYNAYNDFEVVGDYAYMSVDNDAVCSCGPGAWSGLFWIDVSDPNNLGAISSTTLEGSVIQDIAIDNNYVYVANYTYGIKVISTSTASVVASSSLDSAYSLYLDNDNLYVGDSSASYYVYRYNVSNPLSMELKNSYAASAYPYKILKNSDYLYVADNNLRTYTLPVYSLSGSYTSEAIDTTSNLDFTTVDWTTATSSDTDISIKVRTDSSSDMSGATAWGSCSVINNGDDISLNSCVTDGDRYIQYQLNFTTTDSYVTGSFDEINIKYNQ